MYKGKKDGGNEAILASWIIARRQNKKQGNLSLDFEAKINALCPWFIWESAEERLLMKYKNTIIEVKDFYNKYGRPISGRQRENGREAIFVEWISTIKKSKKNNTLDKEIELLINKELPWFIWNDILKTRYNKTIEGIKLFYEKYGEPKCRGQMENENRFAIWLSGKRSAKRKGTIDKDLEHEISVSLPWFVWEPFDEQFLSMLNQLHEFYLKYGVPKFDGGRDSGKEKELAAWIGSRRQDKKQGKLTEENETKIMELCPWFCWDPLSDIYRTNLKLLKEYYSNNGKEPPPKEKHLYQFILKIRIDKRNDKLSTEEYNEIMQLFPWFRWEANEEKHAKNIKLIAEFYKKYGMPKCNGNRENGGEKDLYRWICKRREAKKKGQMTNDLEKQIHSELPWLILEPSISKG
jgi:hypothetical protein